MAVEIVGTEVESVGQEVRLDTYIEAAGRLPLQLVVADILKRQARDIRQELLACEIASGCIGVDVVIAGDIISGGELKIVEPLCGREPRFVADQPSCLQTIEQPPRCRERTDGVGRDRDRSVKKFRL